MKKINICQGQLIGPFEANQNLMSLINDQCVSTPKYLKHIGIQTDVHDVVKHPETLIELKVNGKLFTIEIGKTGIYEIGNAEVTLIRFLNDRDNNTIVDYIAVL